MRSADFEFLPEASEEYVEAYRWYARRSEAAARAFEAAVQRALQLVTEAPDRWERLDDDHRRIRVGRFPYALIYCPDARPLRIVAVAHASRRPGYWRDRG